jgi:hypothetical protein
MKRQMALMVVTVLVLLSILPLPNTALAQKSPQQEKSVSRADLDKSVAVLIGKAGFYQLTDEEGGVDFNAFGQLVPFGRKSYAKITGIPFEKNEDGSLRTEERFNARLGRFETRFFVKRDADGHLLVNLQVERDAAKGGAFDKAEVPFTAGRAPGTFDTIQPADLVGL